MNVRETLLILLTKSMYESYASNYESDDIDTMGYVLTILGMCVNALCCHISLKLHCALLSCIKLIRPTLYCSFEWWSKMSSVVTSLLHSC